MSAGLDRLGDRLRQAGGELDLERSLDPRGIVRRVGDGVAFVSGLRGVGFEDMVEFESGALGFAHDLAPRGIGVVLLTGGERTREGEGVRSLGRQPRLPVGEGLLGRIVDPLGNSADNGAPLPAMQPVSVFQPGLEFVDRKSVDQPLLTGVMTLDSAIPIGRGQRELIVGDRNTGKTSLALDIVAAQRPGDVACVYVMIGQPLSRVLSIRETLREAGVLDNTVLIAAHAGATPGMQFLAPYAGASAAEWFRDQGRDALVVYDDLTKHADVYRELALLLDRPPGREAYPGDIFYVHAELLERASARRQDKGGGTVTALPIVETTDGDISSYIPTNLISITDGQIYLDTARYERNQRPAVDIGRSVSRIGGAAQPPLLRAASSNLRILISRFEALEALTRVGLEVDPSTKTTLRRGEVIRELLRQQRFRPRGVAEQVLTLTAVTEGWLDACEPRQAAATVQEALSRGRAQIPDWVESAEKGEKIEGDWKSQLRPLFPTEQKS